MNKKLLIEVYNKFGYISNRQTDIRYYNLDNLSINDIIDYSKNLNFNIVEFTSFTKPDYSKYNYNNGYVFVYNPNESHASFHDVEYTRKWRYIHELSHAITYPYILDKFNINKVIRGVGALNYYEALIALMWEIETMKFQYKLLKEFGVIVDDKSQNKEINTLLADLVYRCLTGEFSNPDLEGFVPVETFNVNYFKTILAGLYHV